MTGNPTARVALVAALGALALAGCTKEGPLAGIGSWQIGKSVRADFKGFCDASDGTAYCIDQRGVSPGGQSGQIHLVFASDEGSAPLSEILLVVLPCDADTLRAWLVHKIGKPASEVPKRLTWRNEAAFIAAQLPVKDGGCEVSFVAPDDTARVEKLTGGT